MGLLSLPIHGLMRVFKEVAQHAEDELYNEDALKAELVELHRRLEAKAVSEEDFECSEMDILLRLQTASARRKGGSRAHHPA